MMMVSWKLDDIGQSHGGNPAPKGELGLIASDLAMLWRIPRLRRALLGYAGVIGVLVVAALNVIPALRVAAFLSLGLLLFLPTEYLVHRYALHSHAYLNSRWLARLWIRLHYAHHRVPDREDVILASPPTLLILIAITNPPFMLIFGPATLIAGAAAVLIPFTFFYETVHFSAHQNIAFRSAYFRNRRKLHLLHHFHNERCNYGICGSMFDRLAGTFASRAADVERSATVMNLGYDEGLARSKPLVRIEYERSLAQR